jgi:hypothetical protein
MKALSIKQPWASLIAHGIKDIENRTWKTKYRGKIYIHACQNLPKDHWGLLNPLQYRKAMDFIIDNNDPVLQLGAIIGEVEIIDCVINHPSIWAEKTTLLEPSLEKTIYNWVLANPTLYDKPILNVKGKLSFWEPELK